MRIRTFVPVLALAMSASVTCLAASWQPGVVKDVDESGRKVKVHDDMSFREHGGVQQVFAVETGGQVIYAERNEGWRWTHACEVPVNANVSVAVKGGHMELRDSQGQTYHFKVVKETPATEATFVRPATDDPDADTATMAVTRVLVIR